MPSVKHSDSCEGRIGKRVTLDPCGKGHSAFTSERVIDGPIIEKEREACLGSREEHHHILNSHLSYARALAKAN